MPLARVRLSSKRSPRGDISGMRIERTRNSRERVCAPPSIWRYLRNYVTRAYRPIYSPFFSFFFSSSGRIFSTVSLIRCFVTVLVFLYRNASKSVCFVCMCVHFGPTSSQPLDATYALVMAKGSSRRCSSCFYIRSMRHLFAFDGFRYALAISIF